MRGGLTVAVPFASIGMRYDAGVDSMPARGMVVGDDYVCLRSSVCAVPSDCDLTNVCRCSSDTFACKLFSGMDSLAHMFSWDRFNKGCGPLWAAAPTHKKIMTTCLRPH